MQFSINNPWFMYPGAPSRGYMDPDYIPELHRLHTDISNIQVDKPTLLHLTIGAPMEELDKKTFDNENMSFQMYQLVPDHLIATADMGINVLCLIVCPNKIISPLFMRYTEDYIKIDDMNYKHIDLPITIKIYHTMMPTKDKKRNDKYITNFINNDINKHISNCINIYTQTENDRLYVDMFYTTLKNTMTHITNNNGFNSCFSFAVFNNNLIRHKYNKCRMFKELYYCYKNHEEAILCEWVFGYKYYVVYDLLDNNMAISFVPLDIVIMTDPHANCNFLVPILNSKIQFNIQHSNELIDPIHRMAPINNASHITDNDHQYGNLLCI